MSGGNSTHYLRHNHLSRQSRHHVFLDTEARIHQQGKTQSQSWLCGVVRRIGNDPRRKAYDETADYLDPRTLWSDVDRYAPPGRRTILWCHNLSYDLRISQGLILLPELGWNLQAIVLDGMAGWAKFTQGKRSLVCADFASWASVPLARIAQSLGMAQEPLPAHPERDLKATFRRCRQDVNILAAAVMSTLEWLQTEDLGNQQITGPAQSFSAYRHKFMTHRILVHGDPDLLKIERRAIWAGRTETWRHGIYVNNDLHEFDLRRAYANVARMVSVPTVYVGTIGRGNVDTERVKQWTGNNRALLCECTVHTDTPIVPASVDDRIAWPTGTFDTVLWDPEINALTDAGQHVEISRAYAYTTEPALKTWAEWITRQLDSVQSNTPSLQKIIVKQWSRSLIGRFALQYRTWEPLGESDEPDLYLADMTGDDVERGAQILQAGRKILQLGGTVDGENCTPQITGYITSVCRMRLWELMNVAGLSEVFYVDTDSILCTGAGARRLHDRIAVDGAYDLQYKGPIGRLELAGPRQLTVDGERRYSGVPRGARAIDTNRVTGEVWEGIGEALRNQRPDTVQVTERDFTLHGNDHRREHLEGGHTRAWNISPAHLDTVQVAA